MDKKTARRKQQDTERALKAIRQFDHSLPHTTLLIVRHGETDWNREHRLQGQLDPGLNATGVLQANQLAAFFENRQKHLKQQHPVADSSHHHGSASTRREEQASKGIRSVSDACGTSRHRQAVGTIHVQLTNQIHHHQSTSIAIQDQLVTAVYSSDLSRALQTAQAIASSLSLQVHTDARLRERRLGCIQGLTCKEATSQQHIAWRVMISGHHNDEFGIEGQQLMKERVAASLEDIAARHPGETVVVVSHGGAISCMHIHATGGQFCKAAKNGAVHVLAIQGKKWAVMDWQGWTVCDAALDGFGGGLRSG